MSAIPDIAQTLLSAMVSLDRIRSFLNHPEIEWPNWDTSCQMISFQDATIGWPKADGIVQDSTKPGFTLNEVKFDIPVGKFTLICGPLGSGKTLLVSRTR